MREVAECGSRATMYDIADLLIERAENGNFRLIWIEQDEDGVRSVLDILEAPMHVIHKNARNHGDLPFARLKANWPYDLGRVTRLDSAVAKIVQQYSPPEENSLPASEWESDDEVLRRVLKGTYGGPSVSYENNQFVLYEWHDAPVGMKEIAAASDWREFIEILRKMN